MDTEELRLKGAALLERLEDTDDEGRKALMPELTAHLSACRAAGAALPSRLVELEREIHDSDVEDYFDNMPL